MAKFLFILIISLFLVHEMDSVRNKEWRMMAVLKNMPEDAAFKLYTGLHIPLFFFILFIMVQSGPQMSLAFCIIMDVLLVAHTLIHFFFRRHKNNSFESVFSNVLIYIVGVLAIIQFIIMLSA